MRSFVRQSFDFLFFFFAPTALSYRHRDWVWSCTWRDRGIENMEYTRRERPRPVAKWQSGNDDSISVRAVVSAAPQPKSPHIYAFITSVCNCCLPGIGNRGSGGDRKLGGVGKTGFSSINILVTWTGGRGNCERAETSSRLPTQKYKEKTWSEDRKFKWERAD